MNLNLSLPPYFCPSCGRFLMQPETNTDTRRSEHNPNVFTRIQLCKYCGAETLPTQEAAQNAIESLIRANYHTQF